jgi:hypothetical protein
VHRAHWPTRDELTALTGGVTEDDRQTWNYARQLLGEVRKRRSEAKQALKVPIVRAVIADAPERLARLDSIDADLRSALRIDVIERKPKAGELAIEIEFGTTQPA